MGLENLLRGIILVSAAIFYRGCDGSSYSTYSDNRIGYKSVGMMPVSSIGTKKEWEGAAKPLVDTALGKNELSTPEEYAKARQEIISYESRSDLSFYEHARSANLKTACSAAKEQHPEWDKDKQK